MAPPSLPARPFLAGAREPDVAGVPQRELGVTYQRMPAHAVVAAVLAVVGVLSLWPTALMLWSLWVTDPLKSIGAFVPVVSLLLILRVWRALEWETRGSWWGLALVSVTVVAVHLRDGAVLELVLTPSWSLTLPPHSLVAFAYASGLVLLVGGGRLWRAAWFPVSLMLLVNPVPHVFNRLIDLPLQHASAGVARALAHALGQRLTPDQLYLMFTPDFGMFIAPGCNGMRGVVTMGLIALVAGHLYRFRLRPWLAVVAGAVLLGYLFNLVRLCVLVLYYVLALHWHWLQGHAEGGDYCIGATLFFFAAMLLFAAIRRLSPAGDLRWPEPAVPAERLGSTDRVDRAEWRLAALGVLLLFGAAPYARGILRPGRVESAQLRFPETVGSFHLRRTWPETLDTGQTIFEWAEYAVPGQQSAVAVGVSPVLGAHDPLLCHVARGEDWAWHGSLTLPTRSGPVAFSGSLFSNGSTQYLEATTVCTGDHCGQWASERTHLGLIYSRPTSGSLLQPGADRPIPVLLRVETTDVLLPNDVARLQLTDALRAFTSSTSFGPFAYRYLRP